MLKLRMMLAITIPLMINAMAARADEVGDWTAWNGLSTFGITFEGGYQVAPEYRLRGAFIGGLRIDETQVEDGNTYDIDANLGAITLLLDYTPIDVDWRITGGVLFSRSWINAVVSGSATNPIEYGGESFGAGVAATRAEFTRQAAPMVSAGYDYPLNDSWVLSGEIGAVFVGGVDFTVTGNSDALQDAIDRDTDIQSARKDAADFTIYPFISISTGYRF